MYLSYLILSYISFQGNTSLGQLLSRKGQLPMTTHIQEYNTSDNNILVEVGHPSFSCPRMAFFVMQFSMKYLALAVDTQYIILSKFIHVNLEVLVGSNIRKGKLGHWVKYKGSQFTIMPRQEGRVEQVIYYIRKLVFPQEQGIKPYTIKVGTYEQEMINIFNYIHITHLVHGGVVSVKFMSE